MTTFAVVEQFDVIVDILPGVSLAGIIYNTDLATSII